MRQALVAALVVAASAAGAQGPASGSSGGGAGTGGGAAAPRVMEGHVQRAAGGGLVPVRGLDVVLHRIASDGAGPVDSVRTGREGRFAFRFRPTGAADAVYIASVTYGGIAYFSSPAPGGGAAGDADITVFDTTSGAIPIRVAGRHVVIGAPDDAGVREVEEIFELSNDSSLTRVARGDSVPTWSGRAPAAARDLRAAPSPDIAANAVRIDGARVDVFAPLSPGVRQVAFAYRLPADAFPLSVPIDAPTAVLEVLVEERGARVSGARVAEVASVTGQGRTFRRFLAQDVQRGDELRVAAPPSGLDARAGVVPWIAGALALVMIGAVAWGVRRRRTVATSGAAGVPVTTSAGQRAPAPAGSTAAPGRSDDLLHELALLDAEYERAASPSDEERESYRRRRAVLKARAARALAAERERS